LLQLRMLFLLATLPLLAAHPLIAKDTEENFAVGTCKPKLTSFTTIQDAVSKVPPRSTVLVCPGVYPEQVTISQPLTLQGIADSNLDQIVITVPTGGLAPNVTTNMLDSPLAVAAQVLVQNANPVNITNIAVDGTGGDQVCATSGTGLAGIFYGSGSSGSINRVRVSGQKANGQCGFGIWAENAGSPNQFVTIQGSSVHDIDNAGIFAGSGPTPTLAVRMKDNVVIVPGAAAGIVLNNVNGEITGNDVSNALLGIVDLGPATHVSSNNVTSTSFGVTLLAGGTVQSNDIMNSDTGVFLLGDGPANIQSNQITLARTAIEFSCHAATVARNTINDAVTGLDQVPATFTGMNTFANTGTIRTDCAAAAPRVSSMQAVSQKLTRLGLPPSKWGTPANPPGLRP